MGIDGSGTVVASIDTGVQWDHPALKEQYRGLDYAEAAPYAEPESAMKYVYAEEM